DASECVPGCMCPSGQLDDGQGSCVKNESECSCQHNGQFYKPKETVYQDCNLCICEGGNWICTKNNCSQSCIIYGSGHHKTFDMRMYEFQGHCSYVAFKNKCSNKTVEQNIEIITEDEPCGSTGTTCSKTVRIQLGRNVIILTDGKSKKEVLENGTQISYDITDRGFYIVLVSDIGLTVIWDRKTYFVIQLESHYKVSHSNCLLGIAETCSHKYQLKHGLVEADVKL
ncbi:hypothetical protein AMECASPLE_012482, partial [Ameca splendens]